MQQTNISLPPELYQRIKEYGYQNNLSLSAVIRYAVEVFLGVPPSQKLTSIGTIQQEVAEVTPEPDVTPQHRCDAPYCKSMQAVLVQGVGYTDEGEVAYKRYLCEAHIKAAKKSGEEVQII